MPLYEHVFIARHDISAQQMETMTEKFTGCFERKWRQGCQNSEYWGLKNLALIASKRTARPIMAICSLIRLMQQLLKWNVR